MNELENTSTPVEIPKPQNASPTTPKVAPLKEFFVDRICSRKDGTLGVLSEDDPNDEPQPFALTVELPWRNNQPFVSCVPEGEYMMERYFSNKFKYETFRLLNVVGRFGIALHVANILHDLEGCLGVGENFGLLWRNNIRYTAVLGSGNRPGEGFWEFMDRLKGHNKARLIIRNKRN